MLSQNPENPHPAFLKKFCTVSFRYLKKDRSRLKVLPERMYLASL